MAQKIKFGIHRTCLICLLLFATVGCDQVTKLVVRDSLPLTGPISYLNDSIRLQYARNPGAFLSLGAGLPENARFWIFNIAVTIFLIALALSLFSKKQTRTITLIGLSLVLGGGIGNLIDRFFFGSVTDFLVLGVGQLRTGIFNFADLAVVMGILLIALPIKNKGFKYKRLSDAANQ